MDGEQTVKPKKLQSDAGWLDSVKDEQEKRAGKLGGGDDGPRGFVRAGGKDERHCREVRHPVNGELLQIVEKAWADCAEFLQQKRAELEPLVYAHKQR